MNSVDRQYHDLLTKIHDLGVWEDNRTGIKTKNFPSFMFFHNMAYGFPLLTLKRTPFKSVKVELEGFIQGITSKKWYQERGCTIWDEWCNPQKVPYGTDDDTKAKMKAEDDLGLIYGHQWREFDRPRDCDWMEIDGIGNRAVDQLYNIVYDLKRNPHSRRMVCSAWNPLALNQMALPPCHVLWQVTNYNGFLNLAWFQRSCDVPLGIPFNIASYGLLLHLLCKETGLLPGYLTGFLNNVHYYENQEVHVKEILGRTDHVPLPTVLSEDFAGIFMWTHEQTVLENYHPLSSIKIPVAV